MVKRVCAGVEPLQVFLDEFTADRGVFSEQPERRMALGWFLYEYGPVWTQISLLACVANYLNFASAPVAHEEQIDLARLEEIKTQMQVLNNEIELLGLNDVHEVKPLLSFNELSALYEMSNMGRLVKPLQKELISFHILDT